MKRAALVLTLGLFAGALAHTAWFAARRPQPPDRLEAQLDWMRARLELNVGQYQQIKMLHEQLGPKLGALADEVERMRLQLAAYEHQRVTAGQIDFIEFARFVQQRRSVDAACSASTQRLVDETVSVMTPEQRARYLSIVAPALNDTGRTVFH